MLTFFSAQGEPSLPLPPLDDDELIGDLVED